MQDGQLQDTEVASVRSANATSSPFRLCRQLWMAASSGIRKQLRSDSSSGSWWMQAWCCLAGRPRTTSGHTSNSRGKRITKSSTAIEQYFSVCVLFLILSFLSIFIFFTRLFSTHHCQSFFRNNFQVRLSFVRRRSFPQQFSSPPKFCEAQKFSATIFKSA